jgi:hypothetical protein
MISAADFAAGAQQLVLRLAAYDDSYKSGDGGSGWEWRLIRSAFHRRPVSS